jgi:transcription antitermination factor NusG
MGGSYGIAISGLVEPTFGCRISLNETSAQWFAVETRHRFEKKVVMQLDHKGFPAYLPLLTEQHQWSDRQKAVTIPLFPGYAFVQLDRSRSSCQAVLHTAGLIRFVSFGGTVAEVPHKQIEDLQLLLREKGQFSFRPFVHTGRKARVRGGCLHGLEGILMEREKDRLVLSIHSIHRSLSIEIHGYELELV